MGALYIFLGVSATLHCVAIATYAVYKSKQLERRFEKLTAVKAEKRETSKNWHCYETMKCYFDVCSALDPYEEEDSSTCQKLLESLEQCRKDIQQYIVVDKTPAMSEPIFLINAPPWVPQPKPLESI